MSKTSIKDRIRYTKTKAMNKYSKMGATIAPSDNNIICFLASFGTHENKVKVVVDEITEADINSIMEINVFPYQSRQIYCKLEKMNDPFLIEIINDKHIKILYHPQKPAYKNKVLSIPKFLETF